MRPDLQELKFLVIGPAPKNRIWAGFANEKDAQKFSKDVPYGKVIKTEEYKIDVAE